MISLALLILFSGIVINRHNFLVLCMILELIYLLLGYWMVSLHLDFFVLLVLGITGAETAIGLSIILGYYLRTHNT